MVASPSGGGGGLVKSRAKSARYGPCTRTGHKAGHKIKARGRVRRQREGAAPCPEPHCRAAARPQGSPRAAPSFEGARVPGGVGRGLRRGRRNARRCGRRTPVRCRSSVVEHSLGKGEVESSILSGSIPLWQHSMPACASPKVQRCLRAPFPRTSSCSAEPCRNAAQPFRNGPSHRACCHRSGGDRCRMGRARHPPVPRGVRRRPLAPAKRPVLNHPARFAAPCRTASHGPVFPR